MAILFTILAFKCLFLLAVLHITFGKMVPYSTRSESGACPVHCICLNHTVACNSMHLDQVPIDLPTRTKVLFLQDNNIENIDFKHVSKLKELEEFILKGNHLRKISTRDIDMLPKLRHLDLSDNPIVCDCDLAQLVKRTSTKSRKLKVTLGETQCALPAQYAGLRAHDILFSNQICRHRQRRYPQGCHPQFCSNGGTCVEIDDEPICRCPGGFEGIYCERQQSPHLHGMGSSETLSLYLEDVTASSIKVSWRVAQGISVRKYLVSLRYREAPDKSQNIWTNHTRYTFFGLKADTGYEVCVEAFESLQSSIAKECENFNTHLPPSGPGPEPEPGSERPSRNPNGGRKYKDDDDIIHQAAVILGSIIGVCAFFIIFLTFIYKFRTLRNTQLRRRRSQTSPTERDVEASQQSGNPAPANPGREIIVLSVSPPETSNSSLPDEGGATGSEPLPDARSAPDPATINSVLQALKQSSRSQQDAASTNTVVLYHPESGANTESDTTSQDNPSGNAPIYIVADGNHYPLDPTLSEVLRSAMSRTSASRIQIPNEPPPPYSERAEDHPSIPNSTENTRETSLGPDENSQQNNASSDQQNDATEQCQ